MTDRVETAAIRLIEAFETKQTILGLEDEVRPRTRADSFAIQDVAFERLGRTVGAWKVGGSPGTDPTASPIAASRLFSSGHILPSENHRNFGIEAEIAFRLGKDLPQRDEAYSVEEIRDALATLIVAIEVVESRFADWPEVDPLWALMDFQANDSLVLGTEQPIPVDLDFASQKVELLFDDKSEFEATGSFGGGDPLALITWLANHMRDRAAQIGGLGLKTGDVVTTGSWNGVSFAAAGITATARFPGLGEVKVQFA